MACLPESNTKALRHLCSGDVSLAHGDLFMFKGGSLCSKGNDREFPGFRLMQASCDHWHFHVQMMMFEFKGTFMFKGIFMFK